MALCLPRSVLQFGDKQSIELVSKHLVSLAINWIKARNPKTVLIPAQGIRHTIERTMAFLVLIRGEILLGTLPYPPAMCRVLKGAQLLPTSLKLQMRLG